MTKLAKLAHLDFHRRGAAVKETNVSDKLGSRLPSHLNVQVQLLGDGGGQTGAVRHAVITSSNHNHGPARNEFPDPSFRDPPRPACLGPNHRQPPQK